MQPYTTWRAPAGYHQSPPRPHPFLSHHTSMLDLHDQAWPRSESPSTSSSSSSSALDGILTPRATSSQDSTPSRSTTPKAPTTPPIEFRTHLFGQYSKNPFFNKSRPSPPVSPKSIPNSHPSSPPDSDSRCPTPVAPIPVRPIMTTSPNGSQGMRFDSGHSSPSNLYEDPLTALTPKYRRERDPEPEEDFLPPPHIMGDPLRMQREFVKNVPTLIRRKNWNFGDMIMKWAIQQPKTAVLVWMCGELDAVPRFVFYDLTDNMLPFTESKLRGIAADPARIVVEQWKIGILKNLPRDGEHVEFQTQDTVPLLDMGTVGPVMPSTVKTRTKVKYSDGFDSLYYVRKRLEVPPDRPRDKTTILNQIRAFRKLDHPTISKIVASYAQGQVVAFIMPFAEINLADFLEGEFIGFSQSEQILTWVKELASGLAYIHQAGLEHKNIRPQKILVDVQQNRIFFTVFGVTHPMRKTKGGLFEKLSNEPGYVYAAPEVIAGRGEVDPKISDTFSLGAVFLEMVSFAKGRPTEDLRQYRSARTHDNSFHANLPRISNYIENLRAQQIKMRNPAKRVRILDECENILAVTRGMLSMEPRKRPSMRRAEHILMHGPRRMAARGMPLVRRNSLDGRAVAAPSQSAFFNDLASLNAFYGTNGVSQSVYGGE